VVFVYKIIELNRSSQYSSKRSKAFNRILIISDLQPDMKIDW